MGLPWLKLIGVGLAEWFVEDVWSLVLFSPYLECSCHESQGFLWLIDPWVLFFMTFDGFWMWKLDHLERTQRTSQWMAKTWGTRVKGLKTGHMAIVIDFLESCRLGADFNDGSVKRCPTDPHRLRSSCLLNPRMWSLCSPETMEDLCVTIIAAYFFVWWWWSRIYQCDWRSDS